MSKLNIEQIGKITDYKKECEKCMKTFNETQEGTKEKGDALKKFIELKEKQYKIKSKMSDRVALKYIKQMYNIGLKQKKWLK